MIGALLFAISHAMVERSSAQDTSPVAVPPTERGEEIEKQKPTLVRMLLDGNPVGLVIVGLILMLSRGSKMTQDAGMKQSTTASNVLNV